MECNEISEKIECDNLGTRVLNLGVGIGKGREGGGWR
jgi:hypothetical protein